MKKFVKTNLFFALSFILVLGPNFFSANSLAWADEALGNSLLSQANDAINEDSSPNVSGLENETFTVSGSVTNETSSVVKGFAVKLTSKTTSTTTYSSITDKDGKYSFESSVEKGEYTLKITKVGYVESTKDVSVSSESAISGALEIDPIEVAPITYTVAYNSNGGSGTVESKKFTYDVSKELSSGKTLSRSDYTLKTWNTKADGSGQSYSLKQSVSNLTSTDGDTITLYAQWEQSGSGSGGGGGSSHKGGGSSDSTAAGSKSKSKSSSSSKDKDSSESKSHSSKDKDDSASSEGKSRGSKDSSSSNVEGASYDASGSGKTIVNPVVTGVGGVVAGAGVATGAIFLIQHLIRKRKLK